jgi:tRNA G10  N-methylase Trm11
LAKHPAKFSKPVLELAEQIIPRDVLVLDPFAGTGLIHTLEGRTTIGNELEIEWASMRQPTIVGDATRLAFRSGSVRWLFTSPTYGNRFSDHHNASDGSLRHSYTHTLGRKLTDRNTGAMPWGKEYRTMHILAWFEAHRVMARRGRFVLNVSNFIKNFEEVDVVGWHLLVLEGIGFRKIGVYEVKTRRMKQGSKKTRKLRVAHEYIIVFEKP